MEHIIYVEEGIYIIQKEILRTIKTKDRDMRVWCANSEQFGYSTDLEKVEIEANRLNKENINKDIRYTVYEVKELK